MRSTAGVGCRRCGATSRAGPPLLAVGRPPALRSLLEPDVTGDAYPGLDVEAPWQAVEACFAQGWTDGLPVVPPTAPLVERMLAGGPWRGDAVLLHGPARDRAGTAWHAAINAVMAGCRPEYFPVVGAALAALGDPEFTLHGPATSTGGAALMVIVNGPVREAIGLHGGGNLFGPGV